MDWGFREAGSPWIRLHTGGHNAGSRAIAERLGARELPEPVLATDHEGAQRELVGYVLACEKGV